METTARGILANAKLLIERGAPLDAINSHGLTPLSGAIQCLEEQSEWTPNDSTVDIAATLIGAGRESGIGEDDARCGRVPWPN
jgi:hypothetical protein